MTRINRVTERSNATPVPGVVPFAGYSGLPGTYDEYFDEQGEPRAEAAAVARMLLELGQPELQSRQSLASGAFLKAGVTFGVYSDNRGGERPFPFDVVPRVVGSETWAKLEAGVIQRIAALNAFLRDVYGAQRILKEGVIPRALVEGSAGYLAQMRDILPPGGNYVHIAGIDLIRDPKGDWLVLEDNVRTPSGVSYVLENRSVMKRLLSRAFAESQICSVDEYPTRLKQALSECAPRGESDPMVVVLTPGQHNSAYFEHTFLARRMGVPLVQGSDLFVEKNVVYVKTIAGPRRVDVIYRRIDDDFLDPRHFRADSLLGVPGLVSAYAAGNVALANAIGNGVADDKAIYPFVPDMIRFYLDEEPVLRQVETYICARPKDCQHVLANLSQMVVKTVNGSGGYGMLMGYKASRKELEEFAGALRTRPRDYIAQPLISFSACPTLTDGGLGPRRVDLRPFAVTGKSTWVLPGGLTRVALTEGSFVVNSSQGGGSKDTWVVRSAA